MTLLQNYAMLLNAIDGVYLGEQKTLLKAVVSAYLDDQVKGRQPSAQKIRVRLQRIWHEYGEVTSKKKP